MINWATIGEEKFNRAVELLITKTIEADNPGLVVTAIDGRGGDGGIDLDVRVKKTDQLVAIYQLKHFPEGFSGEWARARKPQIKKSFEAAKDHSPDKWVLVIPRNFAAKERSYVNSLKGKSNKPRIERIGVTQLDEMLARFPEVEDYINRDASLAALKIVGRESALLARPEDLATEISHVQKRIDARSIYWGSNFSKVDNLFIEELVPLRPDASEREPLSISLTTDFSDERELGEEYKRALEYGSFQRVQLPARVVKQLERFGPEWFTGVIDVLGVDLLPAGQDLAVPVKVVLKAADGRILAQPTCLKATAVSGGKGAQLRLQIVEGVELTFVFEKEQTTTGDLRYEVTLEGLSGTMAKRSLKFLTALANAKHLNLEIGSIGPLRIDFAGNNPAPDPRNIELAEDLAVIEDELGISFSIPADGPRNYERIWIRVVRKAFEGAAVYVPGSEDLNFTLTPPLGDEGKSWLTADASAMGLMVDGWEHEVLGETVVIGDVTFAVFNGHVVDGAEHLAAIEGGDTDPRIVTFAPKEKDRGVIFFMKDRREPNEPIVPTAWDLTGIPEHPHFRTIVPSEASTDSATR